VSSCQFDRSRVENSSAFRTEHSATASAIAISATGLNRSKFGSDVADAEGASLVPTFGN
jgi:hypothetical protein